MSISSDIIFIKVSQLSDADLQSLFVVLCGQEILRSMLYRGADLIRDVEWVRYITFVHVEFITFVCFFRMFVQLNVAL